MKKIILALIALMPFAAFGQGAGAAAQPVIAGPTSNQTGVWINPMIWWSHCTGGVANLTCANFDVNIYSDLAKTDKVWESFTDLGDLFSVQVTANYGTFQGSLAGQSALAWSTDYYVEVAQQGRQLVGNDATPDPAGWSTFSTLVKFTTRAAYSAANYFVRPNGNANCTGLVDADYPGSGTSQPCAKKSVTGALSVATHAGDHIFVHDGTYLEGAFTISTNRIEIEGESRAGTIIKSSQTIPACPPTCGPPVGWLTVTSDQLYITNLTLNGASCVSSDIYNNLSTWSTSNQAVISNITFGCNLAFFADDAAISSDVIAMDFTVIGQRKNAAYTSGKPQGMQIGGNPQGNGFPRLALIRGEVSGWQNNQSSTGAVPDHQHMEDMYWHDTKNHTFEHRGGHELTFIRCRWKANATGFGEGIRSTCDPSDSTPSPKRIAKYVTILNCSGDDQVALFADNCPTGQAASYYDIGYFSEVNTITDDSGDVAASGASDSLFLRPNITPASEIVQSSTKFHVAYNVRYHSTTQGHTQTLIDINRPATGALTVTTSNFSSGTNGWQNTNFFSGSNYRPDKGSLTSNPLLTNTQAGNFTPLSTSPVINAGDPAIRVPAGGGSRIDIGAVEFISGVTSVSLSVAPSSVTETDLTDTVMNFTVTQSSIAALDTTFNYATSAGTATAGADYVTASGVGTIQAGFTTTTIPVTIKGDVLQEPTETLNFTISNPSANVTISVPTGVGSIIDNDNPTPPPPNNPSTIAGATMVGVEVNDAGSGGGGGTTSRSLGTAACSTSPCAVEACNTPAAGSICLTPGLCRCYHLTIDGCAGETTNIPSETVEVRIVNGSGSTTKGMFFALGGGSGLGYYSDISTFAGNAVLAIRSQGYRYAEYVPTGNTGWLTSTTSGHADGPTAMACRDATVMKWMFDNLYTPLDDGATTAFCAIGESNGSDRIAYSIDAYGLKDLYDYVLLTSGPAFGDMATGCRTASAPTSGTGYPPTGKNTIGGSYGFLTSGTGPCFLGDTAQTWTDRWNADSHAINTGLLADWGTMKVSFRYGSNDSTPGCTGVDCSNAPYHGHLVYLKLAAVNPSLTDEATTTGPGHTFAGVSAGATEVQTLMLANCTRR